MSPLSPGSTEEEKKAKLEIDQWFATNLNPAIQNLAHDVTRLDFKSIMAVSKEDWIAMTLNILATVGIVTFLSKYRPMTWNFSDGLNSTYGHTHD